MIVAQPREYLHQILLDILDGYECYFQPPDNVQMSYPCIVYDLSNDNVDYANNKRYRTMKRYEITIMDYDPDSEIPDKVADLPYCSFIRHYSQDNLHHFIYEIYF